MMSINKLDVALISESHAVARSDFRMKGYNIYFTPHPDGLAHAGSALIIKSNIKHTRLDNYSTNHIQATSVRVEDLTGPIVLSAVYSPPKHKITQDMYITYFKTLGNKFVAGGDWNAKHLFWGSRITLPRGRELKNSLSGLHLTPVSTGEPTYWPADRNRLPDLIDFFVTKSISHLYTSVESNFDGSSDHTPIILTLSSTSVVTERQPETLTNYKTDWHSFRSTLDDDINLKIPLKSEDDVDSAAIYITNLIQTAAWKSTPHIEQSSRNTMTPLEIKKKILEKRRLRRVWQLSRTMSDKKAFNRAAKDLKLTLVFLRNINLKHKLESMSPHGRGDESLWKATKIAGKPQECSPPIRSTITCWARTDLEKAEVFATHLAAVFKPNSALVDETEIEMTLKEDFQMCLPLSPTSPKEIAREIKLLNPKKAPGFDLISPRVLKELPRKCITFLACLFNAIFRTSHFPAIWKISEIIMVHKPGKPLHEPSSYRPISLTPTLSKLWEKIFLVRLNFHMDNCDLVPAHQFGFRKSHSTIEQMHRVYHTIRHCYERKQYCSASFLDVQQAFDKVWHKGLLYKVKQKLPHSLYPVIASYLSQRFFRVKQRDARSSLQPVEAGVPQGSVLGPVLYNLFTYDLPTSSDTVVATYADDIAFLASDNDPRVASAKLQDLLNKTQAWFEKWRIRVSGHKSNHITFTLRKDNCPPVHLGLDTLPHSDCVKYLGFHLDRRLTWKQHIKKKRNEANIKYKNLHWLMGRNSVLSVDNKLLIYNAVIKPVWAYGVQLWNTASKTNMLCLQRVQNKILRTIANAPWFTKNDEIHEYLDVPTVAAVIAISKVNYCERLANHPNPLVTTLLERHDAPSRLKRRNVL